MDTYKIETETGTLAVEAAGFTRSNEWVDFHDAANRTILSVPTDRVLHFGIAESAS
ncbi:hypothetical protein [Streptomyces flavidovirens]